MQDTRRPLTALSTALLMAISPMVFGGCATTLVPGGGTTDGTLDLTTARVIPGGFFGVRHDSIKSGDAVKVRFVGSNGFDITVETTADSDGETRVAAPPLINMNTGAFETGDVMVSIEGITGERTLLLDELPVLEGWTRGELMTAVLDQSIADLVDATANTAALGDEFPTSPVNEDINNMTTAMNEIKALRDELANSGELEFQLADGTATTLSGDEIDTLERYLAGILLGASQEMDRLSGAAKTNGTLPQSKVLGSSTRVGFSRQDFQNFQNSLERGVKGGSVLLAVVAVGVGLVSLFGAGPVAAVATAAGVAIAGVTAIHAAATSTAVRASSRALLNDAGEKFDAAQFAMEQGFNIGLNFLGGIPGKMGRLFTSASTYLSARGGFENMADIKCGTEGNRIRQSQLIEFCSLRNGGSAPSDDNADSPNPVDDSSGGGDSTCDCPAGQDCIEFEQDGVLEMLCNNCETDEDCIQSGLGNECVFNFGCVQFECFSDADCNEGFECVSTVSRGGDCVGGDDQPDESNCGCAADEFCSVFVNPDGTSGFNCIPCEKAPFGSTCPSQ